MATPAASAIPDAGGQQRQPGASCPRGFVRIEASGDLTIPDFPGNGFFNTLGNILLNREAGLVFIDFETGDLLQLSGDADVVSGDPGTTGTARSWRFHPRRILLRSQALPLRQLPETSLAHVTEETT